MIVNDDSSIISKWSFKLIDNARVIIYDPIRFVIQATGKCIKISFITCLWPSFHRKLTSTKQFFLIYLENFFGKAKEKNSNKVCALLFYKPMEVHFVKCTKPIAGWYGRWTTRQAVWQGRLSDKAGGLGDLMSQAVKICYEISSNVLVQSSLHSKFGLTNWTCKQVFVHVINETVPTIEIYKTFVLVQLNSPCPSPHPIWFDMI
jgi:hypothetical protein